MIHWHMKRKYLNFYPFQFSSVQLLSHVPLFATPWTTARQASLSITNSRSLPKLMSIELVMPSNHLILCHPLLLLPSIFPNIRVFSNESALCIRWPKYWSFSFNISPSNEHPGVISLRMDWLDPLAVQETLKSHLQHHSSKASILQCSISQGFLWAHNILCWLLPLLFISKGFLPTPNHWWKWLLSFENVNLIISIGHYELPLCFRIWFSG